MLSIFSSPLRADESTLTASQTSQPNFASDGTFGIQLWLIEDQSFFEKWNKAAEAIQIPSVNTAKRGIPINPIVIFTGLGASKSGIADVNYDVLVTKPDGSTLADENNLNCWVGLPAPKPKQLQLCVEQLGIRIGPQDPSGNYTVSVIVKDNITGKRLSAFQHFVVQ